MPRNSRQQSARIVPRAGLRSLTFANAAQTLVFASPRRERVTRLTCESVMVTVCVYARRCMLAARLSLMPAHLERPER